LKVKLTHTHHIVPRHAGGTDDPSNLIELTIEEHAEAHKLLWETYGRDEDRLAWLGLSGQIGKDEILAKAMAIGASKAGKKNVESGHLLSIASIGGKVGGAIAVATGQLASVQHLAAVAGGYAAVESGRLVEYNKLKEAKFILVYPCGKREQCSGLKPTAKRLKLSLHGIQKCFRGVSKTFSNGFKIERVSINDTN
jgi:hypothetical protein